MTVPPDERDNPSAALTIIKAAHAQGPSLTISPPDLFAPINLGRPRPANSFEQTPADLLRWAEARGKMVSDDFRAFVAEDEALRAAAVAKRKRRPGAGRPSTKTQYDTWAELRRDLYHRLVRLPAAGRAAGWGVRDDYLKVLVSVFLDPSVPTRKKAFEVLRLLARKGIAAPVRRTVDRHLKELEG